MKYIITLLLFVFSFVQVSIAQTNAEMAKEKGSEAVRLMDDGHIDRSIELLEEAQKLDSKSMIYPYEIAYAYYLKKEYKDAAAILKKLEKHSEVNDLVYQLLGNSYDLMGNRKEAIKIYEKGIKKFPKSGKLYLEMGIVQLHEDKYDKAIDSFEDGISADPAFPSNYYWASKLFCSSDEEVWGMIYGELFMNLERNSKRTVEISKILFDTYKNEIKVVGDTAVTVSFSKNNIVNIPDNLENFRMPFGIGIYEPMLLLSAAGVKEITIQSLSDIRSRFVDLYYQKGYNRRYPNVLYEYQNKVKDSGHMEAYNYWILMQGDKYECMNWQMANQDKWNAFIEWFSKNPIEINERNKFDR
ncbi:MAG: tetratricopeptide repeat protein [Dysgonomonas sp.]